MDREDFTDDEKDFEKGIHDIAISGVVSLLSCADTAEQLAPKDIDAETKKEMSIAIVDTIYEKTVELINQKFSEKKGE
jgi:hypothetical protein